MTIDHISQANYPFYGNLPMGITNFGGDLQISTVPDFSAYQIGCTLNGGGLASINGYNNPPLINNWGFTPTTNPFANGMEQTGQRISGGLAAQTINTNLQTIAMAKQRLNSMLLDDGYTKKQQEVINKLIDRLTAEETKLNDLAAETNLKPTEVYKKAAAIEKNIRAILTDISRVGAPGETPKTSGGTTVDEDGNTVVENDEDGDGIADYATFSDEGMLMAEQFYNAVEGPGTDDAAFEEVCKNITPENVIDVMQAYNEMHSAEHGESFMHAFMYDADRGQKIELGKHIKNALMIRARQAGVLHKCKADFAAIDKELNSWVYVNNDVYKNYDNIVKIIAEAEGQPYNTADHKESKDKTGSAIATGCGAAAGAALGAKIGSAAGPVGFIAGGLIGGAIGWLGNKLFG